MSDADYGVTRDGFVLKGIDVLVAEQQARAREMFGADVDLSAGSPIRKILDATAWQAHELWRALEREYYANFITTAQGASLDLLGDDTGVSRRRLFAEGDIEMTLSGGEPGRAYAIPEGSLFVSAGGVPCRTLATGTLTADAPSATVRAQAMVRGVNVPPGTVTIPPEHAAFALDLGTAMISAANGDPFSGGERFESDSDYRARLRGLPRGLWTLNSVRRAVLDLDGVRDCLVFDPLGGADVSQSYFNTFRFGQRAFSQDRRLASPYYFDVIVATHPGWPWRTTAGITGTFERVVEAVREVRPVSVFPNVIAANEVEIGLRAVFRVEPGHDQDAILGAVRTGMQRYIGGLSFGRDVRYADVVVIARRITGVIDVQDLHLRRCPALLSGVNFGGALFRHTVEAAQGENIELAPDEIPFFAIDSRLIEFEVRA